MSKKILKPVVKKVGETEYGKLLASDPAAQQRHKAIVAALRQEAREDVQATEHSRAHPRECDAWFGTR